MAKARAVNLGIEGFADAAVIGQGGSATVYRARQLLFNRVVAVKVLTGPRVDEHAAKRFERERAAIGALGSHPNIVTVHDSGFTDAGEPYLVMEYLPGSLADRVAASGPVPWPETLAIGVKLSGALETAHRLGVLHRDVKPENILLSEFGEPKLTDFGIAWVFSGHETASRQIELSVLHAAPEIVNGESATERSDVYSLASSLYSVLAGHPAFEASADEPLVRFLMRVATDPVPKLPAERAPEQLCALLDRAMAKDPNDRPASACEFGEALQEIEEATGQPATTLPVAHLTRPAKRRRSSPATAATSAPPPAPPVDETAAASVVETAAPTSATIAPPPGRSARAPRVSPPPPPKPRGVSRRAALLTLLFVLLAIGGVVGALALAGRHSNPKPDPTPNSAPTSATAAPTTAATAPAPPADPGTPFATGPVPAGAHHTSTFRPPFRMQLDGGWELADAETDQVLNLAVSPVSVTSPGMTFVRVDNVFDPNTAPATRADAKVVAVPADLARWIASHPRLHADPPVATQLGGVNATRIDFTVTQPYTFNGCAGRPCVALFPLGTTGSVGAAASDRNRLYTVPVSNGFLVVLVTSPPPTFDATTARTEQLLKSLSFTR